jgi:hypothetical protein
LVNGFKGFLKVVKGGIVELVELLDYEKFERK